MKDRRVKVPEIREGIRYRAMCSETGEVLECADLAVLLRRIAESLDRGVSQWSLEIA